MATNEQEDVLRKLAEKATRGKLTFQITGMRGTFYSPEMRKHEADNYDDGVDGHTVSNANRNFLAAASPDVILSLLDEIAALRAENARKDK